LSSAEKWMKLESMLNEISQNQKDKYCMFSLIYRIYILKNDMKVKGRLFRKREDQ
jgi:hypothetical protein